jgi:hypothetical protein
MTCGNALPPLTGVKWFKRIWSFADCGLPGGRHNCQMTAAVTTLGPLNYVPYSPKMYVSCLVTAPARSWQCGV